MLPEAEQLPTLPISVDFTIYHCLVITLPFPPLLPKGTMNDERNAGNRDITKPFCINGVYVSPDSPYLLWRLALLHMRLGGISVYVRWKLIVVKSTHGDCYFLLSTYLSSIFRVSLSFVLLLLSFVLLFYFLPLGVALFLISLLACPFLYFFFVTWCFTLLYPASLFFSLSTFRFFSSLSLLFIFWLFSLFLFSYILPLLFLLFWSLFLFLYIFPFSLLFIYRFCLSFPSM